jgi:hypothetical protein
MTIDTISAEIILLIFSKISDVKSILKFIDSSKYVFDIYKEHIDLIIHYLLINNKDIIGYVIKGCFLINPDNNMDQKVNLMRKLDTFLSINNRDTLIKQYQSIYNSHHDSYNIDIKTRIVYYYYLRICFNTSHGFAQEASKYKEAKMKMFFNAFKLGCNMDNCNRIANNVNEEQFDIMTNLINRGIPFYDAIHVYNQINKDNIEKIFKLIDKKYSIWTASFVINNFNEEQINRTEALIKQGFSPKNATNIVHILNETTYELFMKIASLNNDNTFLDKILDEEEELITIDRIKNIIKLLENNFSNQILLDIAFNDNANIDICIELKTIGINEDLIKILCDRNMLNDLDNNKLCYLNEHINDHYVIFNIINNNINDEDIKNIIDLIKDNMLPQIAYNINTTKMFSQEQINLIKPYFMNFKQSIHITAYISNFIKYYSNIELNINLLQELDIGFNNIMKLIFASNYFGMRVNFNLFPDIINIIKKMKKININDDIIINFIINYSEKFINRGELNYSYESPIVNTYINLIHKGIKNMEILNFIMGSSQACINIIENLNETNINIFNTFNELQYLIFINLILEGQHVDNTIIFIQKCNKDSLMRIKNFTYIGEKYTNAVKVILRKNNTNGN